MIEKPTPYQQKLNEDLGQPRPGEVTVWKENEPCKLHGPSCNVFSLENMTAEQRKNAPVATGVIDYFPDALVAVAECSKKGNDQHNLGKALHWDRSKSQDESDALMRHFIERGKRDSDGIRHSAKVAWRALALLQKEIESGN